jgi:hypothetical protein
MSRESKTKTPQIKSWQSTVAAMLTLLAANEVTTNGHTIAGILLLSLSIVFLIVTASSNLRRWIYDNRAKYYISIIFVFVIIVGDVAGVF